MPWVTLQETFPGFCGYLGGWKVLFTAIMSKKLVKLTFSPLLQAFILKVVDEFFGDDSDISSMKLVVDEVVVGPKILSMKKPSMR